MRTKTPRLPALMDDELDDEQEEIIGRYRKIGVDKPLARSLVRQPAAMRAFNQWARHVMMSDSALTERQREILAFRTAWGLKCGYVWAHHIDYGRKAGLEDAEREALKRPIAEGNWNPAEAALIAAADAFLSDAYVPDDIWAEMTAHFGDRQLIDAIFVVGHFNMLAMFTNTAGIPVGDGASLDPDLDVSA